VSITSTGAGAGSATILKDDLNTSTTKFFIVDDCIISSQSSGIRVTESQTQAGGYRDNIIVRNCKITAGANANKTGVLINAVVDYLLVDNCEISSPLVGVYIFSSLTHYSSRQVAIVNRCYVSGIDDLSDGIGISMVTGIYGGILSAYPNYGATVSNCFVTGRFHTGIKNVYGFTSSCVVIFNSSSGNGTSCIEGLAYDCTLHNVSGGGRLVTNGVLGAAIRCGAILPSASPFTYFAKGSALECNFYLDAGHAAILGTARKCECGTITYDNASNMIFTMRITENVCTSNITITTSHASSTNEMLIANNNCGNISITAAGTNRSLVRGNHCTAIAGAGTSAGNYIAGGYTP
jgi:hypothetical protein